MVAKEWRDARWKFALGTLGILAFAAFVVLPYERMSSMPGRSPGGLRPADYAVGSLSGAFGTAGGYALIPLAVLIGVTLVSGEVAGGTIYLTLSKPLSRSRLLLTKYCVGAVALLAVASVGSIGLLACATVLGYPLDRFSALGVVLSTILLWLGILFVFGIALLMSVAFRSVIGGIAAASLTLYLALPGGTWIISLLGVLFGDDYIYRHESYYWFGAIYNMVPTNYWTDRGLYLGESLAPANFVVCLISALVPLLAALWLFNRKAY